MTAPATRPTLSDVARTARVSLATVDRVLNRRAGVRPQTIAKVEAAMARLGYRPDPFAARLARGREHRFAFLLPSGSNTFMNLLAEQVERTAHWLAPLRGLITLRRVDVFAPEALAAAIREAAADHEGLAVVALDHPVVRAAIDEAVEGGCTIVTLVSDVPNSRRLRFVGVENAAAGRTAASLLGRFTAGRTGEVAVLVGSLGLRDHAERLFGFRQVLGAEYPHLAVLQPEEGRDDTDRNGAIVARLLAERPNLVGIYNAGAGNRGVAAALAQSAREPRLVFIGHELTPFSRRFLIEGVMDAVINQDPGHEARSAARILMAAATGEPIVDEQEKIRLDIFIRDNLV